MSPLLVDMTTTGLVASRIVFLIASERVVASGFASAAALAGLAASAAAAGFAVDGAAAVFDFAAAPGSVPLCARTAEQGESTSVETQIMWRRRDVAMKTSELPM